MLEKSSAALKKYVDFWRDFPSNFREKLIQNRKKDRKNCLAHESRQRIQVGSALFEKKLDFGSNFGVPLGPRGVRGASQNTCMCPSVFACAGKPAWNVPREAPGPPWTSPWHLPGSIFRRFWMHFSGAFHFALFRRRTEFFRGVAAFFGFFYNLGLDAKLVFCLRAQ